MDNAAKKEKVKFVQISYSESLSDSSGSSDLFALDDKGRIWTEKYDMDLKKVAWKMMENPDEPDATPLP